MKDFRMKIHTEVQEITEKISKGENLSAEEMKMLFLGTYLNEESNEQ